MRRLRSGLARHGRRFSRTGLFVAVVFFCFSQTPSLIPRPWLFQALLSGISVATGYGVGTLLAWLYRKLGFAVTWSARTHQVVGWCLAGIAIAAIPTFLVLGEHWQRAIRELFGIEIGPALHVPLGLLIATALAVLLLQI